MQKVLGFCWEFTYSAKLRKHFDSFSEAKFAIGLDGRSVIEATRKRKFKTGQQQIDKIHSLTRKMRLEEGQQSALTLKWVPGHKGLLGNELADREAKKAASGLQSDKNSLPVFLQDGLPASVAAIKQTFQLRLKEKWKERFQLSKRFQKFVLIDPKGSDSKFLKNMGDLRKRQSSLLIQLRTGHIALNKYLHRIGKKDSPNCSHCAYNGRSHIETVKHFILECPAYSRERYRMRMKIGHSSFSINTMLSEGKAVKALLQFIGETGQLNSSSKDDHQGDQLVIQTA